MSDQFNIEAEQAVLGAMLRDNDAFDRIPELDAAHFYRGDHRDDLRRDPGPGRRRQARRRR
jgi:replicative DNA helicase